MNISFRAQNRIAMAGMTVVATAMIALLPSASTAPVKAAVAQGFYHQTNLVSDQPGVALILDTNLVNPWGISMSPTGGAFWVANNVTGTATLYTGDVNGSAFVRNALVVTIPGGSPTGTVFNSSADFVVNSGVSSARSVFLFASQAHCQWMESGAAAAAAIDRCAGWRHGGRRLHGPRHRTGGQ